MTKQTKEAISFAKWVLKNGFIKCDESSHNKWGMFNKKFTPSKKLYKLYKNTVKNSVNKINLQSK